MSKASVKKQFKEDATKNGFCIFFKNGRGVYLVDGDVDKFKDFCKKWSGHVEHVGDGHAVVL